MKTLAIVIGNDEYHASAELKFAVKDSHDMATVFARLGYEVIHRSNINAAQCADVLNEIAGRIADYDATIFFFAGHGFQVAGENYLTSIECQIPPMDPYNCGRQSIKLSELLDIYSKHPNKINIVIIDACRRAFGRGQAAVFAPVQAPNGTLIAFSTSPEEGAKDGGYNNQNSIYTGALLEYIGREMLSVEELFKKVRKTVYRLTNGTQTPWEHTSLIGDFYFNTGQLVHSPEVPYSDEVVKDANFQGNADDFTAQINEMRSANWDRQNPAVDRLLKYSRKQLDRNQQFILGRNLLQAAGYAFHATDFFQNLGNNLSAYMDGKDNHVLNGILFEIYFDSHGEFRQERFKAHCFEEIMALRSSTTFAASFEFIVGLLRPHQTTRLFWLPSPENKPVDVDVQVTSVIGEDFWKNKVEYDMINSIGVYSRDIIDQIVHYGITDGNELALKKAVANYLSAPENLVAIHSGKEIKKIAFPEDKRDSFWE